jgi:outer membrane cobalamin receptor
MKKKIYPLIALLITLSPGLSMAEEQKKLSQEEQEARAFEAMFPEGEPSEADVHRADQLLITATGSEKPLRLAPSVASVITAEDIERIGATTLNEVLETVPGLHMEPNGTAFLSSTGSTRGLHTVLNHHILFLINSVPLKASFTGGRPLKHQMPVAMISRVEVVRGPGSALHGADAFSGVINVITKDNHEIDGTSMGMRGGSFDSYDAWLQHGNSYGQWEIALGLEWQKSRGDNGRVIDKDYVHTIAPALSQAPGPLPTGYELMDITATIRRGNWEGHLYSTLQKSDSGLGSIQALADGSGGDYRDLLADLNYSNDQLFQDVVLKTRLYYSYITVDNFLQQLPASFLDMKGNPISEQQNGGVEVSGIYSGFSDHELRLGTGWENYNYEPDQYKNFGPAAGANQFGPMVHVTDPAHIFMPSASRRLFYGLVQDEWNLAGDWQLTAGVRYDDYSDFGSTTNPRLALVWETSPQLTSKLLYGQAYRAPSFSEQWVKNNPQTVGNPDLGPEETETLELAFDYQPTNDLRMGLNFFVYESEGMIELTGPLPQTYENIGEQEGHGFEWEMAWRITDILNLNTNFAYQRSKIKANDSLVPEAPGMQFYLNPHWQFLPDHSLDLQYYWVADRPRAQADPREEIDNYSLVNLTLRRKNIAKHWDAALAIRNLFDEDGRIPSPYAPAAPEGAFVPGDYPMEGRSFWAEVRFHF